MPHRLDDMKAYVGFDALDEARLRAFWPLLEPQAPEVIRHFYERLIASPGARAVLTGGPEQLARLHATLGDWLREVICGPWDGDWIVRHEQIGRRHVEVGLPAQYMFTAMCVLQQHLDEIAHAALPADQAPATCRSVQRAMYLNLAIMTGAYVESREERQLTALQDLLVAHLRTVVMLVAEDGRVVAATRPTKELCGGEPVLGEHWTDAVPAGLLEAGELVSRAARARQTGREITLPRVDVEEPPRSFRVHLVPLEHPMASLLVQIEELTDAVALEARVRRNESLAQLGSLSAAVAHELRNPLAGISGALQVIGASLPEGAPYRPIMGKVEQEVHRLNALVTDLLAFAKPERAQLEPQDLTAAAQRSIELVRGDWPSVRFECEGQGRALADGNLTHQILLNLLQNAAQAVEGKGTVRVLVEDGRIVVADDGPGIAPERRDEVFQPFFTTKTRGTGLGLSVSERSAHAMRGRLRLLAQGPLSGAAFALDLEPVGAAGQASPGRG